MLIDKEQAITYLSLKKHAYERTRSILQADVVQECINEIEAIPEYVPSFAVIDERGKVRMK